MYYNPSYMNPIMESLYPSGIQPTQPQQQPAQPAQPQQGIASLAQATPPPQGGNLAVNNQQGGLGIGNHQFIEQGVGQFNPADPGNLPMGQHPLMGMPPAVTDANIGDIQKLLGQQAGYGLNPPQQPGMGNFDHLTDNPYVQGPPDNFVTIEGVRYNVPPVSQPGAIPPQQTPTPPPQQVGGGMYFPGGTPGFDESAPYGQGQQFNPNQGIASLAGTSPGI